MKDNFAIQLRGITKTFPGVKTLDNVGFDVRYGTVHTIAGENGAGKTTLMNNLYGLYQPDEGGFGLTARRCISGHPGTPLRIRSAWSIDAHALGR
jgi:ABC-type uncharacterized transport system ATPase subunit